MLTRANSPIQGVRGLVPVRRLGRLPDQEPTDYLDPSTGP
jgi:hypothetical protein